MRQPLHIAPPPSVSRVCPECRTTYGAEQVVCPRDGARLGVPAPVADPLIGQVLAGRYKVMRTLGEGGMGRVYLAEHARMGRLSAVKVMSPALAPTPEAISRFNREAANASRISQPNVAAIYDFGETDDGTLYLAMEYVEGETLSALIRRDGPLPAHRAAELTGQIADGLHAAHHLGIVHRDLKPDNVLITRLHDGREWAKIVDFGIAKTTQGTDQTVTSLGVSIGTPEYMSPEQIAGESLDARTDVYSLGLVLFNMLTGALPHPALTSKQSLVHRLTARPRTLAEVRPSTTWPARLQVALDRALAPEPADRFAGVDELARVVRAAVGLGASGAPAPRLIPARAPDISVAPTRRGSGRLVIATVLLMLAGTGTALGIRPPGAIQPFLVRVGLRAAPFPRPAAPTPATHDSPGPVMPAGSPTNMPDSSVAIAPADDSLSPIDAGLRLRRAGARSELHANGDSLDPSAGVVPMQGADVDAREVMLHVTRGRDFSRGMQLKLAGLELRTAYQEYRIFLTEHASTPQVEMLRRELQVAMDEALAACGTARDSVAARGGPPLRCEHPAKTGVLVVEGDDASSTRTP